MTTDWEDAGIVEELLRRTDDLTQIEAAAKIGVSQKTVSSWRAGARPKLQPGRRRKLLEILGAPTTETGPGSKREEGAEIPTAQRSLSRQIDEILHSDADELTKTARMIDLWGITRQQAISDVAELLRGDREILRLRAEALWDLSRTARLEAEQAARRAELSLNRQEIEAVRRAVHRESELPPDHTRSATGKKSGTEALGDRPPGA